MTQLDSLYKKQLEFVAKYPSFLALTMKFVQKTTIETLAIPVIKVSRSGYVTESNLNARQRLKVIAGHKFSNFYTLESFSKINDLFETLRSNDYEDVILRVQHETDEGKQEKSVHATCQKIDSHTMLIAQIELGSKIESLTETNKEIRDEKGEIEANYKEAKTMITALQNLFKAFPQNTIQVDRFGHYQIIKDDKSLLILEEGKKSGLLWEDLKDSITNEIWTLIKESQRAQNIVTKEVLLQHNNKTNNSWLKISALYGEYYSFISYTDISGQKKQLERMVHEERLSTIGVLAGGLAHQYNNLHHALLALISEAKDETESKKARSSLNSAESLIEKGSALSQSLLGHLRESSHDIKSLTLSSLFKRVQLLVKDEMIKQKCNLEIEEDDFRIKCNPTALDQVLVNLIINGAHACLATDRESLVRVYAKPSDDQMYVDIIVEDNGAGIPQEHIPRLFTPLFSTKGVFAEKNSKFSKIKGTGLGLSLAKQLMEEQGGTIELLDTNAKGTQFKLRVPKGKELSQTSSLKGKKKKPEKIPEKKYKVLIVDDTKENREILKVYLKNYALEFLEQSDGQLDSERLKKFDPDIIFLDWLMPEYSGHDFLTEVRKQKDLNHYLDRLVILSGLDTSQDIDRWRGTVKQVLRKPVSQKNLIKVME